VIKHLLIDGHHLLPPFAGKAKYTLSLIDALCLKKVPFYIHLLTPPEFKTPPHFISNLHIHRQRPGLGFYHYVYNLSNSLEKSLFISTTSFISSIIAAKPIITIVYDTFSWQKQPFTVNPKAKFIESKSVNLALKRSSAIITISEYTKKSLMGYTSKPVYTILPAIKKSRLTQKTKVAPYILSVGTQEPRKNYHTLISAYHKNYLKNPKFPDLIIAGKEGWGKPDLHKIIRNLGLQYKVTLIADASDERLSLLYTNCLYYISIPYKEGFGLTYLEAISHHKAVIGSNTSAVTEAVGPCGIVLNPHDVKNISRTMDLLLIPSKRHYYEKKTPRWLTKFSLASMRASLDRLIDLY
jgi:glycosyltransferase involved in cell wall biosynthesis